jgi:hypothetical protein
MSRYPIEAFIAELDGIPFAADPATIRMRSRERFPALPALRRLLQDRLPDIIVHPRDKEELARCVTLAVRHRIPLTARGGGTAQDGQSVPLEGGVLVSLSALSGLVWQRPGAVRALAGTAMGAIDARLRPQGWELRLHPATASEATCGGFVAGGHGGIGGCSWGSLRDRGNIAGLEVMSIELEPRLLELRGRDIELVRRACGTNAIITEVELPTAPAWCWREMVVAFPSLPAAAEFAVQLGHEDGIPRKMISLQAWPLPAMMRPLAPLVPDGHSIVNCMIAAGSREGFEDLVAEGGGLVVSDAAEGDGSYGAPLYEFAYGHALLEVQRSEPRRAGVAGFFPAHRLLGDIRRVHARFGSAAPLSLEFERRDGRLCALGSPLPALEDETGLIALRVGLMAEGITVTRGTVTGPAALGVTQLGPRDRAFKREMDPHALLNPGRLSFQLMERGRLATGWSFRRAS